MIVGRRRIPSWEKAVLIGFLVLLAMLIHSVTSPFLPRSLSKVGITKFTGISLPRSAKVVNCRLAGFMEEFYAIVEMDPADVDAFVTPLAKLDPVGNQVSRKEIVCSLPNDGPSWWNPPTSPKRFVSFWAGPSGHSNTHGLIDLDDKQHAVLYLHRTR